MPDRPPQGPPVGFQYAEVAVDAPMGPDRTLTYLVPPGMRLEPGHAVLVPLGPRLAPGIVFARTTISSVEQVRPVVGPLGADPALTPRQLALARWLSRETRSSLHETASLMLPFDYRRRLLASLSLTPTGRDTRDDGLPEGQRRLLDLLRLHGAVDEERIRRDLGLAANAAIRGLLRTGLVVRGWRWQRPRARPAFSGTLRPTDAARNAPQPAAGLGPRQAELLLHLLAEDAANATQARKEFGASVVSALRAKGLAAIEPKRRTRDPLAGTSYAVETPPPLTESQGVAVSAIVDALDASGGGRVFLLHGPTGSGKTEVYLRTLAECFARGKRGILLAPEISLTPQLVARLEGRFPGRVGLIHSGLTPGEQYDTWWRIHGGDFGVVLGSRSAVFAPQPDLGLVILDEEHEWTYKQAEASPRYHARDVAVKLAELHGATVVFGSATPDIGSFLRARRDEYRLLTLPGRVRAGPDGGPVPVPMAGAQVVDMRDELKAGVRSIFSRPLQAAMRDVLVRGEQAILFLNRRGAGGTVQCRDCGHVLVCRRCDTSLTYHSEGERLVCHRCGRSSRASARCPGCRGTRIRPLGLGTQRVVQEVERLFGVAAVRWDRDAARERDAHRTLMERFARGDAQVLVGTQMVAQGLHLPRVTLVGVVLADLGLHIPDFRAGERAFQLLCQVAGRAGRGEAAGRVIVQTYSPDHYAVEAGAAQDYEGFYEREIAYRWEHRNPPFARLAQFLYQHTSATHCREEAERLASQFRDLCRARGLSEVDVIGPAPAFSARLRGRYRWQVVVRVPPSSAVDLPSLLDEVPLPPRWTVDVDPVSLV